MSSSDRGGQPLVLMFTRLQVVGVQLPRFSVRKSPCTMVTDSTSGFVVEVLLVDDVLLVSTGGRVVTITIEVGGGAVVLVATMNEFTDGVSTVVAPVDAPLEHAVARRPTMARPTAMRMCPRYAAACVPRPRLVPPQGLEP